MTKEYRTIKENASAEVVEKKSRFIANVIKVNSVEEAEEHLARLRKQYYDAKHNCYAYQIGSNNEIQKSSDDKEPQGTAGKPILEVLKQKDIKDVLVCVTRYFGGTLLGTGGLIRAYSKATKEGILAAGMIEKRIVRLYDITMPYTLLGKVQYLLQDKGYVIRGSQYLEDVIFTIEVLDTETEVFEKWFIEETNGKVMFEKGETDFIQIDVVDDEM